MRRRDLIKIAVGSAAAWPFVARGQQPGIPVIGFLNASSPEKYAQPLSAFLKGLGESGFVDGLGIKIEYRWAEGRINRLPAIWYEAELHWGDRGEKYVLGATLPGCASTSM
jgi:putative ABC transport system substrate-binding protein